MKVNDLTVSRFPWQNIYKEPDFYYTFILRERDMLKWTLSPFINLHTCIIYNE